MKNWQNKVFSRSFWSLATLFVAILLAILLVGTYIAMGNAGWINSYLNCETFIRVDDSANETPDVMHYKSDFMQYRWHLNEKTGKYEFETKWNKEGLANYIKNVSKNVDTEGTVLLKNENDALPLKENAKVSLFGISQFPGNYITTGQGSGYHEPNTSENLRGCLANKGVEINPDLYNRYEIVAQNHARSMFNTFPDNDLNYVEFAVEEAPAGEIAEVADGSVAQYGDSAIFIVSRMGSENGDTDFSAKGHVDNNYMDLTAEETGVLDMLTGYKRDGKIKNIVLVLNTCNAMQFKTIAGYPIDAIMWVGTGGTSSYRALADVLTGDADPNGHLADTYVYDNYSAPSTVNTGDFTYPQSGGVPAVETYAHNNKYVVYQEGIYVGYKYYETRYEDMVMNRGGATGTFGAKNSAGDWSYGEEVAYPFGYGGSYAEFMHSVFSVTENNGKITASLNIENTSDTYSGKDVFQLYLQKPYTAGGIEKAAVELVGFAKTDTLAPGGQQTLTVEVDMREFASYDSYGAGTYVLDSGDYYLAAGTDSHNALNNIIAAKGAVNADHMVGAGNAAFTHKITVETADAVKYATSAATGAAITNRFDDVDPNLYEHTKDKQNVTYLSRGDWAGTYPAAAVGLTCVNAGMVEDMQYGEEIADDPDLELPVYGKDNDMSLIDLMYDDYGSGRWNDLLDQMTFEDQKNIILLGANALSGAPSVNAPGGHVGDGPAGLRSVAGSMAYPGQTVMACTFNTGLIEKLGAAFGMEMMSVGYAALYGPGANIHRNAFGGRNFEYFSEDGVLSGYMLDAELKGLTSKGIVTYTKHFALNDQERNRYGASVWANEQSIREIYLKAFQISIENEDCKTVGLMSSFNRLGCTWAGAHKGLLTDVLRGEWGFEGAVMTDAAVAGYMGVNNNYRALAAAVVAGQDIWLSDVRQQGFGAYAENAVVAHAIRAAAKNNLYSQLRSSAMNGMKSGIRIVEVTPWWQSALTGAKIGVGILAGVCAAMTIAAFAVFCLGKKREVENEKV